MFDWCLKAFLFLLPFQFALNPTAGIDLPLGRMGALMIFGWWLARSLARRTWRLPPPLITGSLFGLLWLGGSSIFWAEQTEFALRKFLFLFNFLPLVFVFFDQANEKKIREWLRSLVFGAALAASIGIAIFMTQWFIEAGHLRDWLTGTILPFFLGSNLGAAVAQYPSLLVNLGGATVLRATAFFPDPHVAAFFFGMSSVLAFGLFLATRERLLLWLGFLLVLSDILTFSRGGYLGLVAGASVFLLFGWRALSFSTKRTFGLVAAGALLTLTLVGQPVLSRFVSSFTLADASSLDRVVLWREALLHVSERPLLGSGLGNYIATARPLAPYREPFYAHNLFLDVTVEIGLLGLVLLLTLLTLALFTTWRKWARRLSGPNRDWIALSLFSATVLFFVHSLFETALYSVHILPLLTLILALAWYDADTETPHA